MLVELSRLEERAAGLESQVRLVLQERGGFSFS